MANQYDAGIATAYGAAKRGGYTGTYAQFCTEQAHFAENAQAVAQAVETAQGYRNSANSSRAQADRNRARTKVMTDGVQDTWTDENGTTNTENPTSVTWTDAKNVKHQGTDSAKFYAEMANAEADNAKESAGAAASSATTAGENATAAANSASAAAESNRQAGLNAEAALRAKNAAQEILDEMPASYTELSDMVRLQEENVPGTTQSITFDTEGNVQTITHSAGGSAVRTDQFTFGTGTITEVRTLNTGASLTIVTNTETLETVTTYTAA